MNYAPQIVESFKESVIEKILVVDDAFDPPMISEEHIGDLLVVLELQALREYVSEEMLAEKDLRAAIDAISEGDLDQEAIDAAIAALFDTYIQGRTAEIDPGGQFVALKGTSLNALDPLLTLLADCGDGLRIRPVGKNKALEECRNLKPDLILMDFFLSPQDRTTGASTKSEEREDRKRSIELLKSMLRVEEQVTPSVILMSSGDVESRVQRYRGSLEGDVAALRFGFLKKNWIRQTGGTLVAEDHAADVLMDVSSSFEFGRILEVALRRWKIGAEAGLKELYKELQDLDVKDFAHLLRFRLYEEGEPFADYLEWFLGESLRAVVDDKVEWNAAEFSRLNDENLTKAIEGASLVPTNRIAHLFHRMRFNSWKNRERVRLGLGDLFIATDKKNVRMVITPDCDLVPRNGKRGARSFLTVGGTIRGLGDEKAHAGDLIFIDAPKSLTWKLKDVVSHSGENTSKFALKKVTYSYHGTMRALAAQAIQKEVLGNLGRVGLPVPPTVNVVAPAKVYMRKKENNRSKFIKLDDLEEARAQVFMGRGGADTRKRAMFSQRFVRGLVARIEEVRKADLDSNDLENWNNWKMNRGKVQNAMLSEGIHLQGKDLYGMIARIGSLTKENWLQILVDVSDDKLNTERGTNPFAW